MDPLGVVEADPLVDDPFGDEAAGYLVRMHLVLRPDLLRRPVTPQRLQRNLALEIYRKPAPVRLSRIPPLFGGTHLSTQSDFPGPPLSTLARN